MSSIKDLAAKAAQSFLSLDDIVLGQGVLSGGLSQLGQAGRSVAGSLAVGSNVAARTLLIGFQAGAKTADVTAGAVEGWLPGAGFARRLARQLDQHASAVGEDAAQLAAHGLELAGGEAAVPRNPLTGEEWLGKRAPQDYGWRQLAADTAVDSFGRLAVLPAMFGLDALRAAADSRPGRMAGNTALEALHNALDSLPGQSSSKLDTDVLRESLLALAGTSGAASLRDAWAFGEAGTRLLFGDPRQLRRAIENGLEEMTLLVAHEDLEDLLPSLPLSRALEDSARQVVDNPPRRFVEALKTNDPGEVLSALADDAGSLRVFATHYPRAQALLSAHAGLAVSAGLTDVGEVEAYLRGDGERRPASAAQLELYVGKARIAESADPRDRTSGAFPPSAVRLAQDVAFAYSSRVLGRERALERSERLHGAAVRRRLAADPSLRDEILEPTERAASERAVRRHVAAASRDQLLAERHTAERQLSSLEQLSDLLLSFHPRSVERRIHALRLHLSLTHQRLALATEVNAADSRETAFESFSSWVDETAA